MVGGRCTVVDFADSQIRVFLLQNCSMPPPVKVVAEGFGGHKPQSVLFSYVVEFYCCCHNSLSYTISIKLFCTLLNKTSLFNLPQGLKGRGGRNNLPVEGIVRGSQPQLEEFVLEFVMGLAHFYDHVQIVSAQVPQGILY